jgi:hypothetical protein
LERLCGWPNRGEVNSNIIKINTYSHRKRRDVS